MALPGVTCEAVVVYKTVDVRGELTVSPLVDVPGVTCEAVVVYKPGTSEVN